ncbi:far upstream element-binding protein 2 [Coccidioides immitis RMSCC 3703]|uniref:Far upstream element-binding protein 2 n=1 Tax=Coccidioides immitis RMSCC 3703 TaxID=454286 RepID=A0A0J8R0U0_COCIT|nr:far upstream element-binding protein 2 [Coccidioides immitis RMSCC 3703]
MGRPTEHISDPSSPRSGTNAHSAAQPGGLAAPATFAGSNPSSAPLVNQTGFSLPPPDSTGSVDISGVKPVNTGSVRIRRCDAKARGIAARSNASKKAGALDVTSDRIIARARLREQPPRATRDVFRDNYNPYRDERRGDRRGNDRAYVRERSFSPRPAGRATDAYPAQPSRPHRGASDRSPPSRRGGGMDDSTETINIDSKLVGLIIGRQGDNLRRIESDTGTRIQFLDSPESNVNIRPCRISGTRAARSDAKAEIFRMISENNAARGAMASADRFASRGPHEPPGRQPGYGEDENSSTQMMVPDRTVGLIIGRGGETIKDLQDRSGCHVIIAPEDKSLNGLRPVNLNGAPRAIQRAKDLILEVVETDSRQGGAPPQREPRGYAPERDTGAPAPERGDDSIFIPKESVGMIIGKGGDTIKELQNITGCKVNILPAVGREVDREVVMIGSKQAIEQMKKSILEKVDTFKSRSQARRDDGYSERYSQPQLRSYPQDQAKSSQPSQASAPAAGGDSADPYAMYGGYEFTLQCGMRQWLNIAQQQQPYQQQSPSNPSSQ